MEDNQQTITDSPDIDKLKGGDLYDYEPIHFMRAHAKNDNKDDDKTQVWKVVFEPDPEDNSKTTNKVATCGGNTVCIIDVSKGKTLMGYRHNDIDEIFFTLAWTTLDLKSEGSADTKKTNILASGGSSGEVSLFHPDTKICFHKWNVGNEKKAARKYISTAKGRWQVNSVVFHTSEPTWLFSALENGVISLWDIGKPTLPIRESDFVLPEQLLYISPYYGESHLYYGEVHNIVWSGNEMCWLLAGTEKGGLVGWHIDAKKIKEESTYKPSIVDFDLPKSRRDKAKKPNVDGLVVVSETTIAAKCALHGFIYVWDLKATTKNLQKMKGTLKKVTEKAVTKLATLRWSNTDDLYMNLGCHKGNGRVVCGDNKGTLWTYNIPQLCKPDATPIKNIVEPWYLRWPKAEDGTDVDDENIIINKVAVSHDNRNIVAVTSNNYVCIWTNEFEYEEIIEDEGDI